MRIKRAASLSSIVRSASESLAEYARWPDTPARKEAVDVDMAVLCDAIKGFDPAIPHALLLRMMSELVYDIELRDVPPAGARLAMQKMLDIIDPPKTK